jgi:GNAT superfamily N-acetyltransferase
LPQPSSSDNIGWSLEDLDFKRLEYNSPIDFDCERLEQNEFLNKYAADDQRISVSVTHILYFKEAPVGFITLIMDEIPLAKDERPQGSRFSRIPALKAAQLGIDKRFKRRGLGKILVAFAIRKAQQLSQEVGCRFVTLDAKPDLKGWYEQQGFIENKLDQKERQDRRSNHRELAISMRFDIKELGIETLEN